MHGSLPRIHVLRYPVGKDVDGRDKGVNTALRALAPAMTEGKTQAEPVVITFRPAASTLVGEFGQRRFGHFLRRDAEVFIEVLVRGAGAEIAQTDESAV